MKKLLAQLMCTYALVSVLGAVAPVSAQSPEDTRTQLLNLADSIQELSALGPRGAVNSASLQSARLHIQQLSAQDLTVLGKTIDPTTFSGRLVRARKVVTEYSQSAAPNTGSGLAPNDTTTFPVADGLCTSANGTDTNRLPASVVLAADVVYFVAEGVKDAATDACNQVGVVVVAGEGGGANTSLACVATDAIYVAAHAVDEGIHFCDDDLTGAVVDANYARLDDIHTDVNGVDSDLNTDFTSLGTQVTSLGTQVSAVDTHITTEFSALSTQMTTLIGGLAAQLTSTQAQLTVAQAQLAAARNELVDGQFQIMKLDLTPDGQKILYPTILTCNGAASGAGSCPNVLTSCGPKGCSWNRVGPLP